MFSNTSRKDNDSKDEVSKVVSQAEKELEEIRKLIDDSGGKLSNRGLESEVRAMGYGIGLNCLGQPISYPIYNKGNVWSNLVNVFIMFTNVII